MMGCRGIPLRNVKISDSFWSPRQRLITDVTVPYMERILRDEVPGCEKSHAIANFRIAAGQEHGTFYGMVFQDSDVAKWLEAAAYSLLLKPDEKLRTGVRETVDLITGAQCPDGYLNTYFTVKEPGNRWKNLLECHELYCAGHMLEAAVALHETGDDTLMPTAVRLADHIVAVFRDNDGIPGHEEIEIGLERMYRATGDARYLEMALGFLNRRGQDPGWFAKHTPRHEPSMYGDYDIDPNDAEYNQSDIPVREQTRARGHAVRQIYLLTAMAAVASDTGEKELADACRRMFDHIRDCQMYVTGAVGSTAVGEAFTGDYDLPPDTMYGETCAAVAMAFFARNMLDLETNGKYADLLELELYNAALAGMQLDGTRFFYVNPLSVDPETAGVTEKYRHVLAERPPWHRCACCPPNLARLIASLGKYIWSEGENEILCHLYIGSEARLSKAAIRLETDYPRSGKVSWQFSDCTGEVFAFRVRIPSWGKRVCFTLNGSRMTPEQYNGYVTMERAWRDGDCLTLSFDLVPRILKADFRVRSCSGRAAFAYGPLVYCAEGTDNGDDLDELTVSSNTIVVTLPYDAELLGGITPLEVRGSKHGKPFGIRLIPYYAWANRGKNAMRVWLRR